ncbi:DUF4199 domain-containing protein [Prevotella aurantiaca]|jgi:hypothetical protein|uniref:DUF4199 domain-containing protein n=1 Tax=Prevotella aurantiaca TaxID=596085 RepID=UPI0023F11B2E|nr:DUF4199 domain-containing protein [Prevotella aurantiaca]
MNYEEIKQLRAYARYDGIYLAIVWAASFTCFLASPLLAILGTFSSLLTLSTPFFVAYRLKIYREIGLKGIISFKRAYFYCMRVFMNATLLFSLLQWLYMTFLDHGKVINIISAITSLPEYDSFFTALGISREEFTATLPEAFSPTTMVINSLMYEVLFGAIISLIVSSIMARNTK